MSSMSLIGIAALLVSLSVSHSASAGKSDGELKMHENSKSWIYSQDFIAIMGNYGHIHNLSFVIFNLTYKFVK